MSQLVNLLQRLATDPALLVEFQTNSEAVITQYSLTSDEIEIARTMLSLPPFQQYKPHRLYVDDDQGGIIFMLYTEQSIDPTVEQALKGVLDPNLREIRGLGTGYARHFDISKADETYPVNIEVRIINRTGKFPDQFGEA